MVTSNSAVNMTRVLRLIYLNHGLSRVEISKRLGLNKSTVSKIVNYLEEISLVETAAIGDAGPTGGRRPIHLRVRPEFGCIMGVEIQTEAFTVVGINLHGDIFFSHTEPLDLRENGLVGSFVEIVRRFGRNLEGTGMRLLGIGVGLPGFVHPVKGDLLASMPFEHYETVPFVTDARRQLDVQVPIFVDNDANCGCWGELVFRHSDRPQNFMFVLGEHRKHTIEMDDYRIMALGLGLVLNGTVHHGADYSAGEFRSILYRAGNINQFSLDDEEALQFLQHGRVDTKIVDEVSRHIAFLVNVLNLTKVVIGGPVEVLASELIAAIKERVEVTWAYPKPVTCEIVTSRLGEQAVAYGAAGMFLERLIEVPSVLIEGVVRPTVGVGLLADLIGEPAVNG